MILYNPLDGLALTNPISSMPRHCFLMTRLGAPIPQEVVAMRDAITQLCGSYKYTVRKSTNIIARSRITRTGKE